LFNQFLKSAKILVERQHDLQADEALT